MTKNTEKRTAIKLNFDPDDRMDTWQLYRSRAMFRATQLDHDFEFKSEEGTQKGDAGDYVCQARDGHFFVLTPEMMEAYQPISDTERAKV